MQRQSAGSRRVGILGGTFDPPHIGHLAAALDAAWELRLDRVLWVVAGDPWQKTSTAEITAGELRWEMVRAALAGHPGHLASDVELRRTGPSYMVDTLRELAGHPDVGAGGRSELPGVGLVLLLGADAARNLPSWHQAGDLADLAEIAVFARNGVGPSAVAAELGSGWPIRPVDAVELDVSSADIRRRVAEDRPIEGLVAPGVCSLIRLHGLYGVAG